MSKFFGFEKLIAPTIITVVYWIGIVGIIVGGLIGLFQAIQMQGGIGGILALAGIFFGLLFWRILCELYIVAFGMYERLGDIRAELRVRAAGDVRR